MNRLGITIHVSSVVVDHLKKKKRLTQINSAEEDARLFFKKYMCRCGKTQGHGWSVRFLNFEVFFPRDSQEKENKRGWLGGGVKEILAKSFNVCRGETRGNVVVTSSSKTRSGMCTFS